VIPILSTSVRKVPSTELWRRIGMLDKTPVAGASGIVVQVSETAFVVVREGPGTGKSLMYNIEALLPTTRELATIEVPIMRRFVGSAAAAVALEVIDTRSTLIPCGTVVSIVKGSERNAVNE